MAKKQQKSFWHFVKLGLNHLSVYIYKAILGILYGIKAGTIWSYNKIKNSRWVNLDYKIKKEKIKGIF